MSRNIKLIVVPAHEDLPAPRDWLLASLSPVQLEAAVVRAALSSHSAYFGEEIVKFVPAEYSSRDSDYVERFSSVFQQILHLNRFYVAVLASPLAHLPDYGGFCNRALSAHFWLGQTFDPLDFHLKLKLGLFKFLGSPDSLVYPPKGHCEGHVPVRLFIMKMEEGGSRSTRSRAGLLLQDLRRIYTRLPPFRYTYTASVYLLEKTELASITAHCVGYSRRIFPTIPTPKVRHDIG